VLAAVALTLAISALLRRAWRRSARGADRGLDTRLERLDHLTRRLAEFDATLSIPEQRGRFGELLLEQLLSTWLPRAAFDTQVTLPGGTRVDAAINIGERVIPIDAKFPHEALQPATAADASASGKSAAGGRETATRVGQRALRRHVESIAAKYVQPAAGLVDFALLYVPSDALYLRWFATGAGLDELQHALRCSVVPVGPSGLYLYLRTVSQALLATSLTTRGSEVADLVRQLRLDGERVAEALGRAEGHLDHLLKAHDGARSAWAKVGRLTSLLEGWREPSARRAASPESANGRTRR
jgi:DNA recombination protein RmuC